MKMAVVRKFGDLSCKLWLRRYSNIASGDIFDWKEHIKPTALKDLMPGPYPKTEEERKKAAARYNLHPEDYKPYKDDGNGAGDYPELPYVSADARDPFYPWDYPAIKKNHGEVAHRYFDIMGGDRFPFGVDPLVNLNKASIIFISFVTFLMALYAISPYRGPCVLEKQMPKKGIHYTFESER